MSLVAERHGLRTTDHGRRSRRRLRRALRERDRLSARLAELYRVRELLVEAARVVERGWMQHGWFTYVDRSGARVVVVGCTPRIARRLSPEQVVSTCLVGAIVQAGGGPSETRSQLVQRSIDLTWHASFRGARESIRWSPSSVERAGHVMDLVRWNDRPERTATDAVALLRRARELADVEVDRVRAHQTDV